jgi:hypothetical protein
MEKAVRKSNGKARKRLDTTLESEGAEFLVLGQLLIQGIPAYKSYNRNAGHDLVAVNPDINSSARIEVKSRWASDAHWNMGMKDAGATDFYIYVRLNRGNRYRENSKGPKDPQYFVIPAEVAESLPATGWGQARLKKLPNLDDYLDRWDLVQKFLADNP